MRTSFVVAGLITTSFIHGQGLIAQGDALLAAGEKTKALAKFDAAVDSAAGTATWTARANALYSLGRFEKALKDLNSALALDSLYVPANRLRAEYAYRVNDNGETVRYADRALRGVNTAAERADLLVLRGRAKAGLHQNKPALADLKEGIGDRQDDPATLKTLARLYDLNGEYAESLSVLETLCRLEPGNLGNWSNRGYELNQLGRYQDALAVLETALGQDKDEPVVLSNKAYALLRTGRDADAMEAVTRSLRSDPNNPYALRTRAELRIRQGEGKKACDDLSLAQAMGSAPGVEELIKEHCGGPGMKH